MVVAVARRSSRAPERSSAPRRATRRHRPRPTAPPPGSRSSSSCPGGADRPRQAAPGARRRRPRRRRATATSTTRSGSCGRWPSRTTIRSTLVNSVNPYRLEGQKTAAFEICDDLGRAPDVLAIPVGNAGNISAYWAGFTRVPRGRHRGRRAADVRASRPPARRRSSTATRSTSRETVATAIRIGNPASWTKAIGRAGRVRRQHRRRHRRRDPRGLPRPRPARGRLLRAVVGGVRRGGPAASRRTAASGAIRSSCASSPGPASRTRRTAEGIAPPIIEAHPTVGDVARALGW